MVRVLCCMCGCGLCVLVCLCICVGVWAVLCVRVCLCIRVGVWVVLCVRRVVHLRVRCVVCSFTPKQHNALDSTNGARPGPGLHPIRCLEAVFGESWLTAAIPMENPYCSCKLTRVRSRWHSRRGADAAAARRRALHTAVATKPRGVCTAICWCISRFHVLCRRRLLLLLLLRLLPPPGVGVRVSFLYFFVAVSSFTFSFFGCIQICMCIQNGCKARMRIQI